MPSPFPGMDPFLEAAEFFPSLHAKLIIYLEEALQPLLPEPYFAQTGERTWIEVAQRYIEPRVWLLVAGNSTFEELEPLYSEVFESRRRT